MTTPLGLGMTHGYFSGLADGRSLRDEIRGYYFEVVEKINREWWDKAGLLKEPIRQDGVFELLLQRDGTIASIRILQGTGSNEADRLLSEIIRNTSPLPSLPATYDLSMFRAPLRIKAPSFLFRLKN
jgi:protein TonB